MVRRPKSEAFAAIHETMKDLHSVGAIDNDRMRHFDEACLVPEETPNAGLTFALYKDRKGEWRWRLTAANGEIIATSGDGYKSKKACLAAIELVRAAASAKIAA